MGNQYWKNKIQLKEAYERGRLEAENEQRQELTEDLRAIFRRLFGIDAPRGGGGGGGGGGGVTVLGLRNDMAVSPCLMP